MAANYVLLEKITVGAATASDVTFTSIPQTGYTDLIVKMSSRRVSGADAVSVRFNGVSTGHYSVLYEKVDSTTRITDTASLNTGLFFYGSNTLSTTSANSFSSAQFYIHNYTSANFKSVSHEGHANGTSSTAQHTALTAGLWHKTDAITSITLLPLSGSAFAQYSTFYLYGVAKLDTTPVIVPYATGGDTIMTDGTYWYHTFVSSGTFTPQKALTADYLVVAGGGGGGKGANSGGGGAGGFRSTVTATGGGGSLESALSLTTTGYTVTIGAGGAGGATDGVNGTDGSNSVFSTVTSTGGGGGGASGSNNGRLGGSGGGGGLYETVGGAGTANQGYAGGAALETAVKGNYAAGGGGGAGATGTSGNISVLGAGGAGVAVAISGSSVTYAGGGGGGANGGTAAGGAGGGGAAGSAGTANTGGGGGGAGNSGGNNVSAGGSGIVIVRYAV